MIKPTNTDEAAIVAAFLSRYLADRTAGKEVPVEAYQALFPDFEAVVAREYRQLRGQDPEATPAPDPIPPGPRSFGPYRLVKEIGRGGQGVVYLAEDTRLHRRVALKALTTVGAQSSSMRSRLLREAEAASKLDHPGICAVHEVGEADGVPFIAMRYVEGASLARRIDDSRSSRGESSAVDLSAAGAAATAEPESSPPASERKPRDSVLEVVALIERAARALHVAHEAAIVHRDVKPGNIMVTTDGRPVLLDFGLSRDETTDDHTLTHSGTLVGTPAYMAPEQLVGQRIPIDRRADVYALAVTLYECLTLRRPFAAPTREQLYQRILVTEPPDPRRFNPAIPKDLKAVLEVALDKDRDRRYQTALDFAEDLRRVRALEPVVAREAGPSHRLRRWAQREPAKAALVGVLLAVTALAAYGGARLPELLEGQRVAAAEQRRAEVEQSLEEGFYQLGKGSSRKAIDFFVQALRRDPETPEAVAGMALAEIRLDRASRALALLEQHGRLEARHPALGWVRAEALRFAGRRREAERVEASLGEPTAPFALFTVASRHMCRGHAQNLRGDRKAELAEFRRTADLLDRCTSRSGHARALYHFELAHAAGHVHDPALCRRAAQGVEHLYAKPAGSPTAWFWVGFAVRKTDPDHAIRAFQNALDARPDDPIARYYIGQAHAAKGEFDKAAALYRLALRKQPRDPDILLSLANAMLETGDLDGAVRFYRRAIDARSDYALAYHNLGAALKRKGELDAAIRAIEQALKIRPTYADARFSLGVCLAAKGEWNRAAEAFRSVLELEPNHDHAYAYLGRAHLRLGEREAAVAALEKALARNPDDARAHCLLGNARRAGGDLPGAIRALRKARDLNPNDAEVHACLARALAESGDADGAIRSYRKVLELAPDDAGTHTCIGVILMDRGDLGGAIRAFRSAIEHSPDDARFHCNLGVACERKGDRDAAIDAFKHALELDETLADAHYNLGRIHESKGDREAAKRAYRRAVKSRPDHGDAWNNLGVLLQAERDLTGALEAFDAAIEARPDQPLYHQNRGLILKSRGDLEGAIEALEVAIRLRPDSPKALRQLGIALKATGRIDAAVNAFRSLVALRPETAVVHYDLGIALKARGDVVGAVRAYEEAIRLRPRYAEAYCNLGGALLDLGRFKAALAAYRTGHELGSLRRGWNYPSADWVDSAERFVHLEDRLDRVLCGKTGPRDSADRLALADVAYRKRLFATAARLWVDAFREDPALAKTGTEGHRYNAACAAALAGSGEGRDAAGFGCPDPRRWRDQAIAWLEAELQAGRSRLENGEVDRKSLAGTLSWWKRDPDLAGIRDEERLAALGEDERQRCQRFWREVDALLKGR